MFYENNLKNVLKMFGIKNILCLHLHHQIAQATGTCKRRLEDTNSFLKTT